MSETILFTDVGEGIHEGKLVKWLVSEGQLIKEDQPLCEIETDKAIVEIPSSKTGTVLKLHGQVGQIMHVGEPLVTVGKPGETIPETKEAAVSSNLLSSKQSPSTTSAALSQSASAPLGPVSSPSSAPKATPAVRKLAQQLGVELSRIAGSGQNGLITENDVKNAQSGPGSAPVASDAGVSNASAPSGPSRLSLLSAPSSQSVGVVSLLSAPVHPALVKATPSVRKLAFELGVDLTRVPGTGPQGHVTEQDVRQAKGGAKPAAQTQTMSSALSSTVSSGFLSSRRILVSSKPGGVEIRKPFSSIRRIISERLAWSQSVPHVTHVDEADVTELWALREKEKGRAEEKGVKLTLLPFVVKAVTKALQEFPDFNAALDEEKQEVVLKEYYDLGIAVDTPVGLMVPVLREADKKSVFEIAKEIQRLSAGAKGRSLKSDELSGSTFTITNIGSVGGTYATPVINPPEAAILGVMRMQTRPAFAPGSEATETKKSKAAKSGKASKTALVVEARQFLPLCLTFDHRLNDGAAAAAFVLEIRKHLENPEGLLIGDV